MNANKKIDLKNPLCPNESKLLANILQNHPLRFSIAASSSVPWIYLGKFWHTLKEDGSKYRLKFMLDKKELTLTLDDFRTIFHLPQATDNNHDRFVPAPKFSETVPFYINNLGFTLELRSPSNFKTTGLVQPWQTLCKMFSRCLTTRVTRYDQPPLQIMHMLYCFVKNIHIDYADLLWEGFHYSLEHPTTLIPYPKFTKLIVSHATRLHSLGSQEELVISKLSRKGRVVKCSRCGNLGHNRKGCRGQGGASQASGSSQAGARQADGVRQAVGARQAASARQATGARNVSNQAVGSRNASSQAASASQPSATPSTASQ
ncbi:hypothetical protein Tco_0713419 [Tanacetum coccineum]